MFSKSVLQENGANYVGLDPSGVFSSAPATFTGVTDSVPLVIETTVKRTKECDNHYFILSSKVSPGFKLESDASTIRVTWQCKQ